MKAAAVTLVGGATSRAKRFRIEGIELDGVPLLLERLLADSGDAIDRRPGRGG